MDCSVFDGNSSFKIILFFLVNRSGVLALSLFLKQFQENWSHDSFYEVFFLLRLHFTSVNLPFNITWNNVTMPGQVLVISSWKCQISFTNMYVGS